MKVNIYYGGRGLIEDSTIYVMNKMTEVLEELRVEVERYNLYEQKNSIATMPNTMKEADAIILAVNVEWIGIGGYMQQFLDACYLYADKERMKKSYMMPVVISNTYGEKDAELTLIKSWEFLNGTVVDGICAYAENQTEFETNPDYAAVIEKKAEDLYRVIQKKTKPLPSSSYLFTRMMPNTAKIELTPQEREQLSVYVSDDTYVKKQKEDIEELAQLFKGLMKGSEEGKKEEYVKNFKEKFAPQEPGITVSYALQITDLKKTLIVDIIEGKLECYYGEKMDAEVIAKLTKENMDKIVDGRTTFQGAFMSGEISAKGNFKALRAFDQIFAFHKLI